MRGRAGDCAGVSQSIIVAGRHFPMSHRVEPRQPWLKSLKRGGLRLAIWCAIAVPPLSFAQGTPEERRACTPDVLRLCSAFIPDADDITVCLRQKQRELSDACRQVIGAGMKPSDGGAGVETRRRSAR